MFGFHFPELIIIFGVVLLLFGPKKLPQIASGLGKSIKEFKKHSTEEQNVDEEQKTD